MAELAHDAPLHERKPHDSAKKQGGAGAATKDDASARSQKGQAREMRGAKGKNGKGGQQGDPQGDELDYGDQAEGLEGGIKGKAEKSLGVGLGGVNVYKGDKAAAANKALGSKAFAHGQDVVLGEGVENAANPIVAHEVAHTVQQRGGAEQGVAKKSERGASGSSYEVEADSAASRILHGVPTKIAERGAEGVHTFEGAEHMQLGNAGFGGAPLTVGKVTLPAGVFTALMGDFYGTWDKLEKDCNDNPAAVNGFYQQLLRERDLRAAHYADPTHNAEPDMDGAFILNQTMTGAGSDYLGLASTNFAHFSEQSPASGKQFEQIAKDNPAYAAEIGAAGSKFGANISQWLEIHLRAAKKAFDDAVNGKGSGDVGVAMDAGACHFLTDAFASGHMRTPRAAMYEEYQRVFKATGRSKIDQIVNVIPDSVDVIAALGLDLPSYLEFMKPSPLSLVGVKTSMKSAMYGPMDGLTAQIATSVAGFGAKVLHDFDNKHGLDVHNDAGQHWHATGDHALDQSEINVKIATQCTAASAAHVRGMAEEGKKQKKTASPNGNAEAPVMPFRSLKPITSLIPQVDQSNTHAEEEAPGGARDWHWATASPAFKNEVKHNAIEAATGTVSSMWDAAKQKAKDAAQQAISTALSALGRVGQWLSSHLQAIVDWVINHLPTIDPTVLLNGLLI